MEIRVRGDDGTDQPWEPAGWVAGDSSYALFGGHRPGSVKAPAFAGEWKYVGDLMGNAVEGVSINEDVSCADFFQLGNQRMLLCISHRLGARYYLRGRTSSFTPRSTEMSGPTTRSSRRSLLTTRPPTIGPISTDRRLPRGPTRLVGHDEPPCVPRSATTACCA
jgi:hypothetical protein